MISKYVNVRTVALSIGFLIFVNVAFVYLLSVPIKTSELQASDRAVFQPAHKDFMQAVQGLHQDVFQLK